MFRVLVTEPRLCEIPVEMKGDTKAKRESISFSPSQKGGVPRLIKTIQTAVKVKGFTHRRPAKIDLTLRKPSLEAKSSPRRMIS